MSTRRRLWEGEEATGMGPEAVAFDRSGLDSSSGVLGLEPTPTGQGVAEPPVTEEPLGMPRMDSSMLGDDQLELMNAAAMPPGDVPPEDPLAELVEPGMNPEEEMKRRLLEAALGGAI